MTVFKEGEKTSMARVGMFFCLVVAAWLSVIAISDGSVTSDETYLVGAWLLAGIGGKSIGKYLEDRK